MKESINGCDKNLIFREVFDSESGVRSRNGTPTAVTFANGVGSFNGTSSYLSYPLSFKGTFSVRIRFTSFTPVTNAYLFDFRNTDSSGTGYIYCNNTTLIDGTSGTDYVDGVASSTISSATKEIVISGMTLSCITTYIGRRSAAASNYLTAGIELLEIYQGTLTANNVKNLYENKAYVSPSLNHAIQLGADLITNGSFATDTSWTKGTGVTIADGKATYAVGNQFPGLNQTISITRYKRYRITFDVINYTSGSMTLTPGGSGTSVAIAISGTGAISKDYIHDGTDANLYIRGDSGFIGSIDNVVVKEHTTEFTQEILSVDARNGIISNKYSGNQYTELITVDADRLFTSDTGFWSKGAGVTIADGVCHFNNVSSGDNAYSPSVLTVGKTYRTIFTIKNYISGSFRIMCGNGIGSTRSANGTYHEDILISSDTRIYIKAMSASSTYDIDDISVKEVIPTITNTAVTVQKAGKVYAMDFNGSTSKLDCGSYDTLVGDVSLYALIKPRSYGEGGSTNGGYIFNNGKLGMFYYGTPRVGLFSDGTSTTATSTLGGFGVWLMAVVTRTSTGVTNFYINGVASGTANQASGTPVAGTTNLIVGNNSGASGTFDGSIAKCGIIKGILTSQEIAQMWTSIKGQVNQ